MGRWALLPTLALSLVAGCARAGFEWPRGAADGADLPGDTADAAGELLRDAADAAGDMQRDVGGELQPDAAHDAGSDLEPDAPVVPTSSWARRFGDNGADQAFGVAVDDHGNIAITGASRGWSTSARAR